MERMIIKQEIISRVQHNMKTLCLEVEDQFYEHLIALLQQMPQEKVHIVNDEINETTTPSIDEATNYILQKNKELYRRLA